MQTKQQCYTREPRRHLHLAADTRPPLYSSSSCTTLPSTASFKFCVFLTLSLIAASAACDAAAPAALRLLAASRFELRSAAAWLAADARHAARDDADDSEAAAEDEAAILDDQASAAAAAPPWAEGAAAAAVVVARLASLMRSAFLAPAAWARLALAAALLALALSGGKR